MTWTSGHQNGSQCRHESHQEHQAGAKGERWNKGSFNRRFPISQKTTIVVQNGASGVPLNGTTRYDNV